MIIAIFFVVSLMVFIADLFIAIALVLWDWIRRFT